MKNSKIAWTHHTFNPWIGCQKVSAGCNHCYAETLMDTRFGKAKWGPFPRVRTSAAYWKQPLAWNASACQNGERYRVLCASLADVFEDRSELTEWRADLFALIDRTPYLDWLLLTKRPENFKRLWPFGWYDDAFTWENVWLGVSVEDQARADARLSYLVEIPAIVRFLSCEPLLGPIDLDQYWLGIEWVIVGGESGQRARPMHPEWARSLRDQCQAGSIPFFFKQWGEWLPARYSSLIDHNHVSYLLDGERFFRVGTKLAGHLLDGREWNEFPSIPVPDFVD